MEHRPENETDFEECDESIPKEIVKAFFNFISKEDNWNDFIFEWDSLSEHYEHKD